jgi:hypothetical protein
MTVGNIEQFIRNWQNVGEDGEHSARTNSLMAGNGLRYFSVNIISFVLVGWRAEQVERI